MFHKHLFPKTSKNNIMNKHLLYILIIPLLLNISQPSKAQAKYLNQIGTVDSLFSNILGEQREIWVELPENYDRNSEKKYPVIYVLDGSMHLKAVSTVMSYYWGGFIPEMIIVGISNRNNRTRDLTTSKIDTRHGFPYHEENGEAERFTSFIEKELIPYVDQNYPSTDNRTIIGHSYAGLFALNVLLKHKEMFDNYLVVDPSLDWDGQDLLRQSKDILLKESFKGKSLFLTMSGQLHMQNSDINIDNVMEDTSEYTLFARSIIEFCDLINSNEQAALSFKWKYFEADLHGTISLPSIMDGLIYLFDWYQIEHPNLFNDPATPKDKLVQLVRYRENKLKEHFGYFVPPFDEDLFNMLGYMNMEWGELEKSLAFFSFAVEYFPTSANAYDSLADYYVSQNDISNALKNVTKAFEISQNEIYKSRMAELQKLLETN